MYINEKQRGKVEREQKLKSQKCMTSNLLSVMTLKMLLSLFMP